MLSQPGKTPARCRRRLASLLLGVLTLAVLGCASSPASFSNARVHTSGAANPDLRNALVALAPDVSPSEASRLSATAHRVSQQLARDYRTVASPHFQNFLVNTDLRKRGLCFHWTEDLIRQLQRLRLTTLELHWAEARAGTLREHNCVVVTARGQPFADGVVLDAWRHSGRLFWSPVRADHYPWKEDGTDYMRRISGGPRLQSATAP